MPTIFTIGHSTRPIEEFVNLLQGNGVGLLGSARHVVYYWMNRGMIQARGLNTGALTVAMRGSVVQLVRIYVIVYMSALRVG
jgi:hypothetical protein